MAFASVIAGGGFSGGRQCLASSPTIFCSPKHAALRDVVCLRDACALPVSVFEATCDAQLQAACSLRVGTFNDFRQTYRAEEHCQFLSTIELEGLKEKVAGKRAGFGKVVCVIATVPIQGSDFNTALQQTCKLTGEIDGVYEDCLVVGSLDLNQTPKLPDEMIGSRPKGSGGQHRRGYLSNVCVAKTMQRNGVGTKLVNHARVLAIEQGITDLYTHVAIDNEEAKRLYEKSGFTVEKLEKTAEARLLGRPPRLLLWMGLSTAPKH